MELNQHLQEQLHSIGFMNTRRVIALPSADGQFGHHMLSEQIPSSMGWGQDKLVWGFATKSPSTDKPMLYFITLTLERNIPREIDIKVTIQRIWRTEADGQGFSTFPTKAEMLQQLISKEAIVIDRYNQMSVARQVNNNLTAPAKNNSNHL